MNKTSRRLVALVALAALLLGAGGAAAEPLRVEVSLKPVHALVAGVMAGIAAPGLIVTGSGSPHGYALRPSEARRIARADLIFWVSKDLERFLTKPFSTLKNQTTVIAVIDLDELTRLPARRGGVWAQDDHAHHRKDTAPAHRAFDSHVWLDPANAQIIARAAARALAAADPANRETYAANAARLDVRLGALDAELKARLAPVAALPYVVFHDAYQYFERRYGLRAIGAVSVGPGRQPGARRLREIRARLRETGARCLFREPQFEPALAHTLVAGTGVRIGILDPLGADLAPGPEAYFTLMRRLADGLRDCLAAAD